MLRRSSIKYVGKLGVQLTGGDRARLLPGSHVVEDCRISDYGRWQSMYQPAVRMEGIGHAVRRCELYNTWAQCVDFALELGWWEA